MSATWNLGIHLLVELYDCNPAILKSLEEVRDAMVSAAKEAKAKIIDITFHEFNPFGISGVVVIAESHLTIHTWPEYCYAAADIFTLAPHIIKPELAARHLIERFESKRPSIKKIIRGISSHENIKLPRK